MAAVKKIAAAKTPKTTGRGKQIEPVSPKPAKRKTKPKETPPAKKRSSVRKPPPDIKPPLNTEVLPAGEKAGSKDNLPGAAGDSRLYLFPVGPHQIFSYWEMHEEDSARLRRRLLDKYKDITPALRFFEMDSPGTDNDSAPRYFDLAVDLGAGRHYANLMEAGKTYLAHLGYKTGHGRFYTICSSNAAETPHDAPEKSGPEWYASSPGYPGLSSSNERQFQPGISSTIPAEAE
jgi:hypothetical protein